MAIQPEISRVKELHKEALMAKPNVIGVGTGYKVSDGERTDELCLVTLVRQKVPPSALQADAMVPKSIEGVRTDVIEIGDVRALQTRTSRWRPAPAGVSLGHYRISAGTFGCMVRDRASGAPLMLSNNHVLANSNDATVGDAILQPGPADGGRLGPDTIALLERFCPIEFNTQPGSCNVAGAYASLGNTIARLLGSQHRVVSIKANPQAANLVDAAVARPNASTDILDEILEIGLVAGTRPARAGDGGAQIGQDDRIDNGRDHRDRGDGDGELWAREGCNVREPARHGTDVAGGRFPAR